MAAGTICSGEVVYAMAKSRLGNKFTNTDLAMLRTVERNNDICFTIDGTSAEDLVKDLEFFRKNNGIMMFVQNGVVYYCCFCLNEDLPFYGIPYTSEAVAKITGKDMSEFVCPINEGTQLMPIWVYPGRK